MNTEDFQLLNNVDIFKPFPLIPLSVNPTKWSNTPKQFVGNSGRIV